MRLYNETYKNTRALFFLVEDDEPVRRMRVDELVHILRDKRRDGETRWPNKTVSSIFANIDRQ